MCKAIRMDKGRIEPFSLFGDGEGKLDLSDNRQVQSSIVKFV